jgi:hypothetical protein
LLELTTNQKGVIAETAIVHRAAKLGYGVARPLDDERYDLSSTSDLSSCECNASGLSSIVTW